MKFLKYLKSMNDVNTDDAIFRSVNINLVDKPTNYKEIIEKKDPKALELINNLNKELKKFYKGNKYSFDFITEEKPANIDNLKLQNSRNKWLKKLCFNFNDKLAEIQTDYEKQIKNIRE